MKVVILAAGQGTRLRPLTDECPKCMVKVAGKSMIERQLAIMASCGIQNQDIYIVAGYRNDVLKNALAGTGVHIIVNEAFETTNMVCSLMCAKDVMHEEEDIIVSYGDIIYEEQVFQRILDVKDPMAVIVDDGWLQYWSKRCEDPLEDAETLMFDENDYLKEIGQKTTELSKVQSQYIGLMRFQGNGLKEMLSLAEEAERRSAQGQSLWRTERNYQKMYMTDLLQGLIDEGHSLRAIHIQRGWYEVDDGEDLKLVEEVIK